MYFMYPLVAILIIVLGFYSIHAIKTKSFTAPIELFWTDIKSMFHTYDPELIQLMIKDSWGIEAMMVKASTLAELKECELEIFHFKETYKHLVPDDFLDHHVHRLQENNISRRFSLQR